jgi:hypothetical protein
MSMSMAAKAAWPLLWTECDDNGVFEWKPIVLKARIFPADNIDFAGILAELETLNCVRRVEIEGKPYGVVRNFGKYQRPKNPSYRFPLPEEHRLFAGFSGSPTPALPQPSGSPTEKAPQMKEGIGEGRGEEGGKEEDEKQEGAQARVNVRFLKACFPRDGSVEYTPWAAVIRQHAPGKDVDYVASLFRKWCHSKGIEFDASTIEKTFVGFCQTNAKRVANA